MYHDWALAAEIQNTIKHTEKLVFELAADEKENTHSVYKPSEKIKIAMLQCHGSAIDSTKLER